MLNCTCSSKILPIYIYVCVCVCVCADFCTVFHGMFIPTLLLF